MDLKTILIHLNDPNWEFFVPREKHEKVPIKGTRNGLQRVNGMFLPILCRNLSVIKKMDVREDDTFVVTYPKSGTNWVAEICWLIQHNLDFEKAHKLYHVTRTWLVDIGYSNELLKKTESPRVFQSHLRYQFLPDDLENKAKIIYAIRNPKDILVSFYYFAKTIPEDKFDGTMEELFEDFVNGEIMYGAWWDHINEYTKLKNIHIVHFEDLLEDPINETRRMAKYLGKDLSDQQLKSIIDFCSFDNLKKSPAFNMKLPPPSKGTSEDTKIESKDQPEEIKLLRKGQIGDWKNHLNEDMWKKIDEIVATKLDYKKPFKYEPTN